MAIFARGGRDALAAGAGGVGGSVTRDGVLLPVLLPLYASAADAAAAATAAVVKADADAEAAVAAPMKMEGVTTAGGGMGEAAPPVIVGAAASAATTATAAASAAEGAPPATWGGPGVYPPGSVAARLLTPDAVSVLQLPSVLPLVQTERRRRRTAPPATAAAGAGVVVKGEPGTPGATRPPSGAAGAAPAAGVSAVGVAGAVAGADPAPDDNADDPYGTVRGQRVAVGLDTDLRYPVGTMTAAAAAANAFAGGVTLDVRSGAAVAFAQQLLAVDEGEGVAWELAPAVAGRFVASPSVESVLQALQLGG
ncbi:hypothetical protein I4F81_007176 [Pyropia yezoensis]|uniref:Uncharacterized protein n=1 Tax=Pyropia yezoensis TaxID=2788 RepID=A0ACC3C3A7_PYRYE|nr:hypothetical protein I4F81_007176 [Neopyropia yezoensis]